MNNPSDNLLRTSKQLLLEVLMAFRAVLFIGRKYICPCCGWHLRAFTWGGTSLRIRPLGYCPHCNSKARQRRLWLFLEENSSLSVDHLRLLHIAPNHCFSRRFMRMSNLEYVQGEYRDRPYENLRHQSPKMDLTALPFNSNSFDAIICQHVLEHIQPDREVMKELFRVLRPGGWATISSPIRWDQKTFEDPTIIDPKERQRAFGERIHVRIYGHDLKDRLEEAGFNVQVDFGKDIERITREKYGLRDDEDLFYCTKEKKGKR
jgi:predicted SAM-dependent methyltransferase